jgi:hypothetical protein
VADLAGLLGAAAAGEFPPPDGSVTVVEPPDPRSVGVFSFTAHHVVSAPVEPAWVHVILPPGDLAAPLNPPFLQALSGRLNRTVNLRSRPATQRPCGRCWPPASGRWERRRCSSQPLRDDLRRLGQNRQLVRVTPSSSPVGPSRFIPTSAAAALRGNRIVAECGSKATFRTEHLRAVT